MCIDCQATVSVDSPLFQTGAIHLRKAKPERLRGFAIRALLKTGVPIRQATTVADCLITANLRGVDSHGIARLPTYVERIQKGLIAPKARAVVVRRSKSTALIDGKNGLGQVLGTTAMRMAMKTARQTGIGAVGVLNANHFGMGAYYGMIAARRNMIGIVVCNAAPAMAPWGGRDRILGTNPLCIAIPGGEATNGHPIVLDMSTSVVAQGRIRLAATRREDIPLGWALDRHGRPTKETTKALEGSLLPIGGPKGYGLAFMIEVFSGVLTGAAVGKDIGSTYDMKKMSRVGFFVVAINVDSFIKVSHFGERINAYVKIIKSSKLAKGVNHIMLPGEMEMLEQERRSRTGIPLSPEEWQSLQKLSRTLKVRV
jgi:LDH2 family malate/lactate/ureidoglycolate dehydrogenase